MKLGAITLILFLIGLVGIMLLAQNDHPITGKISSIKHSENKITLSLISQPDPFVIFTNKILDISKGDRVSISGRMNGYRGEQQIIVDKIWKNND